MSQANHGHRQREGPDSDGVAHHHRPYWKRFDFYYGMAGNRIGMARLDLPDSVEPGGDAGPPTGKV
jgi:hypothetical protein